MRRRTLLLLLLSALLTISLSLSRLLSPSRLGVDVSYAQSAEVISSLTRHLLPNSRWKSVNLPDVLRAKQCVAPVVNASQSGDAKNASDALVIPNVFHMIRFDQPKITFVEMLAIKSVLRLQPCLVVIHCNAYPSGHNWDMIKDDERLLVRYKEPPIDIFGTRPNWVQHKSDLVRLQVLHEFGGIYLDNDCIMLRPIDHLRKHACVVAKSKVEKYLGNMFVLAAPGCRYLKMHEDLYRTRYDPSQWYFNAGELPTTEILDKHPDVAVVVDEGIEMNMIPRLFIEDEAVAELAKEYDVVHTFYNHRYVINDTVSYDTVDFHKYKNTFANIARWLLDN